MTAAKKSYRKLIEKISTDCSLADLETEPRGEKRAGDIHFYFNDL
jgi:hypothetical protein